jgi:tetratricopeptide (TPR) repeat protein
MAGGLLASDAGRHEQADRLFEVAIEQAGDNRLTLVRNWVLKLFGAERYARAAKVLRQAMDEGNVDAENAYILFLLAGALEMDGQTDEALRASRKAVALQPDDPDWHHREAWILEHARRFDDAYQKYESMIRDFDEDHSTSRSREVLREARIRLSNIAVLRGEFDVAEEWLEQVLDEFPGDINALNDLGYLYADRDKHLGRSLRMVRQASEAEPDNVAYLDSVGWALYKLGRYTESLEYLQQASRGDSPDGVILDHMGDVYWQLGRREDALQAWRRAVEAFGRVEDDKMRDKTSAKIKRHQAE